MLWFSPGQWCSDQPRGRIQRPGVEGWRGLGREGSTTTEEGISSGSQARLSYLCRSSWITGTIGRPWSADKKGLQHCVPDA